MQVRDVTNGSENAGPLSNHFFTFCAFNLSSFFVVNLDFSQGIDASPDPDIFSLFILS